MFEQYSDAARRVVFFARDEACNLGSDKIEAHHLLLALLRESWDVFAPFLKSRVVAIQIRDEIETRRFPGSPLLDASAGLPFTHEAKRALAHAAEEAERMGDQNIQPVHILLACCGRRGASRRKFCTGTAWNSKRFATVRSSPMSW